MKRDWIGLEINGLPARRDSPLADKGSSSLVCLMLPFYSGWSILVRSNLVGVLSMDRISPEKRPFNIAQIRAHPTVTPRL